jgi:hypothetical protein
VRLVRDMDRKPGAGVSRADKVKREAIAKDRARTLGHMSQYAPGCDHFIERVYLMGWWRWQCKSACRQTMVGHAQ